MPLNGGIFDLLRAIGDAEGLSPNEKLMLFAFARYTDRDGQAFPAVKTLVKQSGLSKSSVSRALKSLEKGGVLLAVTGPQAPRTKSKARKVNVKALRQCAAVPVAPDKCQGDTPPGAEQHSKGVTQTPKASMNHHETSQRRNHEMGSSSASRHGVDAGPAPGLTTEQLLRKLGVQGPNLKKLARRPGITNERILEELEQIRSDPKVRNRAAVLVSRLSDGESLAKPNRRGGSLKLEDAIQRNLHKLSEPET